MVMVMVVSGMFFTGCQDHSRGTTGALLGAGAGTGIAAIAGADTPTMLAIGAGSGLLGHVIGEELDRTAQSKHVPGSGQGNRKTAQTGRKQSWQGQEMNTVIVNVHNSDGSITQVRLTRDGAGYRGPRGDFYKDGIPSGEKLRRAGYGY